MFLLHAVAKTLYTRVGSYALAFKVHLDQRAGIDYLYLLPDMLVRDRVVMFVPAQVDTAVGTDSQFCVILHFERGTG